MFSKVSGIGSVSSVSTTRPNNTDAYAIGDVIGESPAANLIFNNVMAIETSNFIITGVSLRVDVNAVPSGMSSYRLHLYDSAPTPIADNDPYTLAVADRDKYLGNILIDVPEDIGDTLYISMNNVNLKRKLAADSTTLYGILETRGAYTPSAQAVKTIKLHILGV